MQTVRQLAVLFIPLASVSAVAEDSRPIRPVYQIHATLSPNTPQIEGTLHVWVTNDSTKSLDEAVFFLFPNRFLTEDESLVDDFNRPLVYPSEDFDPGWIEVLEVEDDGRPAQAQSESLPGVHGPTVLRVSIEPLPPGAVRALSCRFRTYVPHRYGSFGVVDAQLTMIGGWHPYLAVLDAEGSWRIDQPPPLADFDVTLTVRNGFEVLLNGRFVGRQRARLQIPAAHYLSMVAAPRFDRRETTAGATRIVLFQPPKPLTSRIAFGPDSTEALIAALGDLIGSRPKALRHVPRKLIVVQAPLRLRLTAPGEGMVVVSDRTLKIHSLLHPFHELQLAQAVYGEFIHGAMAAREAPGDVWWVTEGLGRVLADRFVRTRRPGARTVYEWVDRFNIFSIVDRFESAPQIPFVDSFFELVREADPLRSELVTFNSARPPGRVVVGKLRLVLGEDGFTDVVDRCLSARVPFRECAADVSGRDLDFFFSQWLQPYPRLNYRLDAVALNQRRSGSFRHEMVVRRESSRPISEPVSVELRGLDGRSTWARWKGAGDVGKIEVDTESRVWQAVIDTDRRLLEDRRDDNAWPLSPQVVLDTADVEVTSTEFGIAGLVVGRARYDYRKDIAVAGLYSNRGIGLTVGPRYHWGDPIDATRYRHNLYFFYGFTDLDGSFVDKRRPNVRSTGQSASLGLRYDFTNVLALDNPSRARKLRLYTDWHDASIGSDYNYVTWGADMVLTHPLWSHRSIGAIEILNGFSEALGSDVVPNQSLYSLGGSRSIRGIGVEEQLGRNILLVRTELRRRVGPEVDLNLFDLATLRRAQLRLFLDTGRVSNSAGAVYDVGAFAAGVGIGLGAIYDFMGFFPARAYLEVATRVDDRDKLNDIQVLFGTRQAF